MQTHCYPHARLLVAAFLLTALLPALSQSAPTTPASLAPSSQSARLTAADAHLPLAFEENRGQTDPATRFLAHGAHFSLALTPDALLLAPAAAPAALRFAFVGANPTPAITSSNPLPGVVNYFLGKDPAQWRTDIPTVGQVRYHDLFPGIDLVVYGQRGQWEYDVVVAPGADPARFGVAISGSDTVRLENGDLVIGTGSDQIRQRAPLLYQETGGMRQPVTGGYTIRQDGTVGFSVGGYDHSLPLVIDPVTEVYGTYLGGRGSDVGTSIAVDSAGNAYLTGATTSTNFPTVNPIQPSYAGGGDDVFVTKINAAGTALVYSTYLGGTGADGGKSIAIDSGGNVYVAGLTGSTNFPTMNPIQPSSHGGLNDAFVAKINAAGSALVYSTYLGGSGSDAGKGIAVDSAGNASIIGRTASTNFPTMNAIQPAYGGDTYDAFVTKVNALGTAWVYSSYLGGSGQDEGRGIAVDTSGNAYAIGFTISTNFPTANPLQASSGGFFDAFVAKIASPPQTPTGLHATGATYNSVTWGWTNSDPSPSLIYTVDGSHFYGLAAGTTTFTLYGIPYGSYGCFAIAAYNAYGASSYTPYSCSNVVPITPYNPHKTSATTSGVTFGWSNYDTLSYIAAFDGTVNHALGVNATSYTAPTAAGYFACVTVAAYNATYTSPYSAYACGLAMPAMPSNVHVTGNGQGSVSFAWMNHDPYSGIALTNDGVHLLNEGINATSYTQTGMAPSQYACIEIAAYNSSGASPYTSWVCGQAGP